MSIIETSPATVKSTSPATLTIKGVVYAVETIDPGECGTQAVRLVKQSGDGAVYDVVRTHDGLVCCDCPDYRRRHSGTSSVCKHGAAVLAAGLLARQSPPTVADRRPGIDRVRDEFDEPTTGKPATAPVKTVEIEGAPHAVRVIAGRDGGTFWRLVPLSDPTARDAEVYAADGHLRCDCGQNHAGTPCPHVAALIALGLVAAPAAVWPAWTDAVRFGIDPAAWEGEGTGDEGPDVGPADPEDEWDGLETIFEDDDPDAFPVWSEPARDQAERDRLTLVEYLEFTRDAFRSIGSDAADLVAEAVADLVNEARILGSPADAATFRARRDAMLVH